MRVMRLKKGARKELYQEYLRTDHWRATRARALARAGHRCQVCGATGRLDVHHLSYARLFNERDDDLLALCHACHERLHGFRGEEDMLDLNSEHTGKRFCHYMDEAIIKIRAKDAPRDYLGASLLGDSCGRRLQYEYFNTPRDEPFTGQTLRVFWRGNEAESWMRWWMRSAGFTIQGQQSGFELLEGRVRGHIDGKLVSGPEDCGPYPRLWENKCLGHKSWRALQRDGLKKAHPVYFGQVQLYMAYMELDENPALFTAMDADTMELQALDVPFDASAAQDFSDSAVNIIKACEAGEQLPRVSTDPSWFECKMCAWRRRCWSL